MAAGEGAGALTPTKSRSSQRSGSPLHRFQSLHFADDASVYHDPSDEAEGEVANDHPVGDTASHESTSGPDVEAGAVLEKHETSRSRRDPYLVGWEGPDDPANPKNWTFRRKWSATIVVSLFTFISPVSSSMVAPALTAISQELGITSEIESQLSLSIFVLAYAVGPLFLAPMSEMFGRVPVLQLSNLFYLVFNIACGLSQSSGQLIAFRFLSGLGGSAPLAIGGGVLSDCWLADQRGRAISIYSLAPLLGPAVGPIAGGFISERTTWRWVFWATSIADGVVQILGVFFLQETYAPTLLRRKRDRRRRETGEAAWHTEFDGSSFVSVLERSLVRPFRLLGTQVIVQVLAVYMAFLYGLLYLVLSTFPTLWEQRYHESVGIGGLNYISLGVGFFLATQTTAPINDRLYRLLRARNDGVGQPEFRVPLMVPGSFLVPAGLFWYGWSAQAQVHWIVPNLGAAVLAAGIIICFQCIQTYLVDSYTRYAASAIGAASFLRSLAGFGFPLFAPYLYAKLQYGWGNSLLGFLAIVLGVPAPFLLWKFGADLRARSPFAAG
ncbi:MAG: hypothetical protein M1838_005371 [Thelocarpon superellum]|nr:MAG: hypothetical protein M1838_005371 [Thelocarpon superellum]